MQLYYAIIYGKVEEDYLSQYIHMLYYNLRFCLVYSVYDDFEK